MPRFMLALVAALALSAAAPDSTSLVAPPDEVDRIEWSPPVDISLTAGFWAAWVLSESVLKTPLAPKACRWCGTNGFDDAFRSIFNPTFTPSADGVKSADSWSNIVTYAVLPVAVIGWELVQWLTRPEWRSKWQQPLVDILLAFEATGFAQVLNQIVKFSVGRARPYTIGATDEMLAEGRVTDHNLSFFSGHTTLAWGAVSAVMTIAQLRGYKHWWLVPAVGYPIAATISLLRMAADKHWASDILVGIAVGVSAGILVPRLFHQRRTVGGVSFMLVPNGQGVALAGSF